MSFAIEGRNLSFSVTRRKRHLSGGQVEEVVPILNHCSIRIPTGQLWMLLGPNGCGKSTLLKVLAGLLSPTDGYVCIKRPKSFVFQNPDHQKGVIEAVKNSLGGPREVAALWVTHRLEELKYADGAVYMEDGRVIMHGDVPSVRLFLKEKQVGYADLSNS